MKIKRYHAPDMRRAILLVREDLGPDAVILSNTRTPTGTEIVAAIDYDEALLARFTPPRGPDLTPRREREAALEDLRLGRNVDRPADPPPGGRRRDDRDPAERRRTPAPRSDDGAALARMQNELRTLRALLVDQMSGLAWREAQREYPMRTRMLKRLIGLGLSPALARELAQESDEHAQVEQNWRTLLGRLAHRLQVTGDDILERGGIAALVGPTGVGKTTTIAKLAARYTLRHGRGRVALVSTDCYRIAAHEQLRTFSRILGVPMHVAKDMESLQEVLGGLRDKDLVLIDTAGMSQRDLRLYEQFSLFGDPALRVRTYLVLAANTQRAVVEEVLETCAPAGPHGCIVTKVDETTSLGGVLSAAMARQLPVAYFTDGQRVPEDLHVARSHTLVSRCVAIMQEAGARHHDPQTALTVGGLVAHAHG